MNHDFSRREFVGLLGAGLVAGSGRFLFAANQGTGNIVTFAVDGDRGTLTPTGATVDVSRPVCVQFAAI